jgi:hypothetical protein
MNIGDRVGYCVSFGYARQYVYGTVTYVALARNSQYGQLQDEIEVRLDDGRRCGGPVGQFMKMGR